VSAVPPGSGGPPVEVMASPPAALNEDLEHLKLLSTFHYVAALLVALLSLLPLFHLIAGMTMVRWSADRPEDALPAIFAGGCLATLAGIWMLTGLSSAACLAVAGHFLARRIHYAYCLSVAGVECLFMPVGTLLGVFTLLVLLRPSVRTLFTPPPAFPPPPPSPPVGA
jgi:hypothetical protein